MCMHPILFLYLSSFSGFHYDFLFSFISRITLGNQLDGVRLLEPEVVRNFKKIYPDGNCMKPPVKQLEWKYTLFTIKISPYDSWLFDMYEWILWMKNSCPRWNWIKALDIISLYWYLCYFNGIPFIPAIVLVSKTSSGHPNSQKWTLWTPKYFHKKILNMSI